MRGEGIKKKRGDDPECATDAATSGIYFFRIIKGVKKGRVDFLAGVTSASGASFRRCVCGVCVHISVPKAGNRRDPESAHAGGKLDPSGGVDDELFSYFNTDCNFGAFLGVAETQASWARTKPKPRHSTKHAALQRAQPTMSGRQKRSMNGCQLISLVVAEGIAVVAAIIAITGTYWLEVSFETLRPRIPPRGFFRLTR